MAEVICGIIVIFAVLYVVLTLFTAAMMCWYYTYLDSEATATLTHHDEMTVHEKTGTRAEFKYNYTFVVDGVEYTNVSTWVDEHLNDGVEVTVRYLSYDPSNSLLSIENDSSRSTLVGWTVALAILFAIAWCTRK